MRVGLFLMLVSCLFSCKSKKKADIIPISGITYRDLTGVPGSIDADDWTSDAVWPDIISSKFNFTDTFDYSYNNDVASISDIAAYPNPCSNYFSLNLSLTHSVIIKYIVVDKDANVITQIAMRVNAGFATLAFSMASSTLIKSGNLYRMYYAFYDKNKSIYFKGHGDMKRQ